MSETDILSDDLSDDEWFARRAAQIEALPEGHVLKLSQDSNISLPPPSFIQWLNDQKNVLDADAYEPDEFVGYDE